MIICSSNVLENRSIITSDYFTSLKGGQLFDYNLNTGIVTNGANSNSQRVELNIQSANYTTGYDLSYGKATHVIVYSKNISNIDFAGGDLIYIEGPGLDKPDLAYYSVTNASIGGYIHYTQWDWARGYFFNELTLKAKTTTPADQEKSISLILAMTDFDIRSYAPSILNTSMNFDEDGVRYTSQNTLPLNPDEIIAYIVPYNVSLKTDEGINHTYSRGSRVELELKYTGLTSTQVDYMRYICEESFDGVTIMPGWEWSRVITGYPRMVPSTKTVFPFRDIDIFKMALSPDTVFNPIPVSGIIGMSYNLNLKFCQIV